MRSFRANGFRGSEDGKVSGNKFVIERSLVIVGPESEICFVEIMAVDLISDFARELEESTAGLAGAHDDCAVISSVG